MKQLSYKSMPRINYKVKGSHPFGGISLQLKMLFKKNHLGFNINPKKKDLIVFFDKMLHHNTINLIYELKSHFK